MHRQIVPLVSTACDAGVRVGLITNGMLLPRMAGVLADAGLDHITVSLDGASAETHDEFRRSPDCFRRAVEGLKAIRERKISTRVNTVVGPHNYREMPALQQLLIDLGVDQWELSALKTTPMPSYSDLADVLRVGAGIYESSLLRPYGKPWYGETDTERARYFGEGIPPRTSAPLCLVPEDVLYLDAREQKLYVCSCLPHRPDDDEAIWVPFDPDRPEDSLSSVQLRALQDYFGTNGPHSCTGCSATAARYSDAVADTDPAPWTY